jgi:uncharacterized cupin superfamily protein
MALNKPALDSGAVEAVSRCGYPEPCFSRVMPREKRQLGKQFGLKRIGVNRTTLPPGKESSMRHWHTHEEEFVFVLEGEVVLRTNAGEAGAHSGHLRGFSRGGG